MAKKGMTIGYIRVSSDKQTVKNQEHAILKYCDQQKFSVDDWIRISISSRKTTKQRRVDELLELLKPGDTLIVSELSRLARSVGQISIIVDQLLKKKIQFICIKENLELNGKHSIQTKTMITMFGLFAEIERDLISERTKEGLARAKDQGKILGRPKGTLGKSKLDGKEEEIKFYLSKGLSKGSIAKLYDVTWPTVANFIKTRKLV